MPTLSKTDAERLLRFVAEAGSAGGDQLFTPELLGELGRLVVSDAIAYNELDRVRRRNLFYVERAPDEEGHPELDDETLWEFINEQHPVCVAEQRGRFEALKLSDFVNRQQLRAMPIYEVWLGPVGVQHELSVAIPSPLWHTKTLMLSRHGSRDFTERDRLILDRLLPHLTALWRAANTRRLLRAALAELGRAEASQNRGVVLLTATGDIEFASPPAERLFAEFFGAQAGASLPSEVADWLWSESPLLVRRGAERRLVIERDDRALLVSETKVEADLTPREREVLAWVARGKTNGQIAELLWVTPSTIRKHLENIFAKLGVNTRTAAATRFFGLLDAAAS